MKNDSASTKRSADVDIRPSGLVVVHDMMLPIDEAEETLQAIRAGDIDALVIGVGDEPHVLMVEGAEQPHHLLLGALNEGVMTVQEEGMILFANHRFAEMLERPLSEVLGQRLDKFIVPGDVNAFADLLSRATHGSAKGEITFFSAQSREIPAMLSIRNIHQPNTCFTVVATDLTALKSAEAALRRANEDLEARVLARTAELSQANDALREEITQRKRLEDELRNKADALLEADRRKDEFLSMLAHELRNPLAPILTATEMLRHASVHVPVVERYRSVIERQARNLARIVDDLLDVSRITRGVVNLQMKSVDLRCVVRSAIEAARPIIDASGHSLFVSIPDVPLCVLGDVTRLEQIVVNLLNNAAKYTEPKGKIYVEVTSEDGQVVVRIRDTGVGIPPELLPRVFDLFVQGNRSLDRSQGGLGIGLTMVKSLVAMHGGTIQAHSEGVGRGSEFVFRLPLTALDTGTKSFAGSSATNGSVTGNAQRALIVEDNADASEMLQDLLGLWSYEVRAVRSGEEAVTIARSFRPDVVLLDVGLPGIDGFEVARRLQDCLSGLIRPLLISISGYGQDEDRRKAKEAGIDHHMVKPLDPRALQDVLAHDATNNLRQRRDWQKA